MDYYQFYISDGFTGTGMDRYNTKGWRNRVHRYPMRSSTIGSSTIKLREGLSLEEEKRKILKRKKKRLKRGTCPEGRQYNVESS